MSLEHVVKSLQYDKNNFSLIHHIYLQRDNENAVIGFLNKTISSSSSRLEGLELLFTNIESLPTKVILENAFFWLNICLNQHYESLREIKMHIVGKIVERLYRDQDFTRQILADYMTKILETCLTSQINTYEMEAALSTLRICFKRYSSWFGLHKMKIELFIVNLLSNSSRSLVEQASQAFLYTQQLGGAGIDGINHKTNFSSAFHRLCVTVQKLFDQLFESQIEMEHDIIPTENGFTIPDANNDVPRLTMYIKNCLTFLKTMLMKGFPVAKDIKPNDVLHIILRGTALHLCLSTLDEGLIRDIQVSFLLTNLQIKLIELLDVFILCFQGNLLPFSYKISKLLIDCLSRSQKCDCFKTNKYYKDTVYKVLNRWLRISRCAFQVQFQSILVDAIIGDITPTKNEVKLTIKSIHSEKSNSKSKSVQDSIPIGQNNTWRTLSISEQLLQERNCINGLDTLKYLLTNNWIRIDLEKMQGLYTVIITQLSDIVTKKQIHPYTNIICQKKLFEVLVAFYEEEHLSAIPNINVALNILNKGWNSNNTQIAAVCERSINYLERLCQPTCASFYSLGGISCVNQSNFEHFHEEITSDNRPCEEGATDIGQSNEVQIDLSSSNNDILDTSNSIDYQKTKSSIRNSDISNSSDAKENSVQILDIQILNPSENHMVNDISKVEENSGSSYNQTDVVQIGSMTSEILEENHVSLNVNIPAENLKIDHESVDEPPSKIIKLDVKSEIMEESDDEFVDQMKEY